MKITRMLLVLATSLVGLVAVAGPALAVPPQAVLQEPVNLPGRIGAGGAGDAGFCAFPVRIQPLSNQKITETKNPDGSTAIRFSGFASATVTNLVTGKSLIYKTSGPGTVIINPDGSFSGDASGQNLLWTSVANSFKDVPQLAYTTGRVRFVVDATGQTTEYSLNGRTTDVCAAVA